MKHSLLLVLALALLCLLAGFSTVQQTVAFETEDLTVDNELRAETVGSRTSDQAASVGFTQSERKLIEEQATQHEFQAEVNKLMGIIINSLYSNKEIFLRELISNASDALDKIRFLSLTDSNQLQGKSALEIRIQADPENQQLHITDSGIGMAKEELMNNLGTIAKSGTKEFIDSLAKTGDSNLIGQFGVGFYSAFLVADRVTVTSKNNADATQWVWESEQANQFSISPDPRGNTLVRGTRITLHLKDEAKAFLKPEVLKKLITRYSEFITFPIYVWASHEESEEVPDLEASSEEEAEETVDLETGETETKEEEVKTKTVTNTIWDWERVNQVKPIWTRNPKDVTIEEYNNFYKSISKDLEDPLHHVHFNAEGELEFRSILYVPGKAPKVYGSAEQESNIRLYVKRVFITDKFGDVFPRYLQFVHGIVDSEDLPLNVSREMLQQDRNLNTIKKKLVRKAIAMFQELANSDTEKYNQFWTEFGTSIKLGVVEDENNRLRLSKLLRYSSSKSQELVSLDEYLERMQEGQTQIYFVAAESREIAERSPFVEKAIKRGLEVLYMVDPIDEWVVQMIPKYDNKHVLANLAKEGVKLEGEDIDAERESQISEEFKPLTDYLKEQLKGRISKATVSNNLVHTPCALASGAYGFSANMERVMKAQALVDQRQFAYLKSQRVLEINPRHPLVREFNQRVQANADDSINRVLASILFDTAALQSGFTIEDPSSFAAHMHRLVSIALNIDPDAPVAEDDDATAASDEAETDAEASEDESSDEESISEDLKDEL